MKNVGINVDQMFQALGLAAAREFEVRLEAAALANEIARLTGELDQIKAEIAMQNAELTNLRSRLSAKEIEIPKATEVAHGE
jgi:predicted  nucleic acid-binding Zn-ribbon protein